MNVRRWSPLIFFSVACGGPTAVISAAPPTIWTGPTITFSKAGHANPPLPADQDHLTPAVSLTRLASQGMFNGVIESAPNADGTSPKDTEWATSFTSAAQTIDAANYTNLTFLNWTAAYNNSPGTTAVGLKAVVHLISENIYLNLKFTVFGNASQNAPFAYERSSPALVPEPSGMLLSLIGLVAIVGWASQRRLRITVLTNSLKC